MTPVGPDVKPFVFASNITLQCDTSYSAYCFLYVSCVNSSESASLISAKVAFIICGGGGDICRGEGTLVGGPFVSWPLPIFS